jgi:nitrite reductase/ring-hydroxylating ferredoxin subunit
VNALRPEGGLSTELQGWFCVGLSSEFARGDVRPLTFFGREHVLFRSASGAVAMLDAHCPHLGAHLGHGGRVDGERVVCPFHGFAFERSGRCVGTAYGGPVPARADLAATPVIERGGLLLTWHDPHGAPPAWPLPAWSEAGFSALRGVRTSVATHPQETSENSVDLGHFSFVHGYADVRIQRPIEVEGERLSITYRMRRTVPGTPVAMPVQFHVDVWGLGLSIVTFGVVDLPFEARLFILSTPSTPGHVDLRAATQVRLHGTPWAEALGPWVRDLANRFVLHSVQHDVEQDRAMWEHKRYLARPRVAAGDGPLGRYRSWVRRFYVGARGAAPEARRWSRPLAYST